MEFKDLSFTWKNIIISATIVIFSLIVFIIQKYTFHLEWLLQIIIALYFPVIIPSIILADKFGLISGWFDFTFGGMVMLSIIGFIYTFLIVSLIHWIIIKIKGVKK